MSRFFKDRSFRRRRPAALDRKRRLRGRYEQLESRHLLAVVINEFHYDPDNSAEPVEFIEIFNTGPAAVDLSGWRIDDAVDFDFPNGASIGVGQYLVIAQHAAQFQAKYGVAAFGEWELGDKLSNDGETIELRNASNEIVDSVSYQLGFPWPTSGEFGSSVELIHPSLDNTLAGNWRSSGDGTGAPTPGARNSVFAANAAPFLRDLAQSVQQPAPGQDVVVSIRASDPNGVQSVALQYQLVDPGDYIEIIDPRYQTQWTTLPMVDDGTDGDAVAGDGIYTVTLDGSLQTHRRLVRYRITASDGLGASVTAPFADDMQPNFAYFVYGETPTWTGAVRPIVTPAVEYDASVLNSVATYHLITTRQDHVDSQFLPGTTRTSGYGGSDYLWHGALVYDGVVYDHIRFRARGGVWRYSMGKNMWKFDFNRGHAFQARDDYGNPYAVGWDKLNLGAIIQQGDTGYRGEQGLFESVGFKLFNLAGVEAPNTNFVQFRIIENANESIANQYNTDFQGLYLAVEQLDGRFLDEHELPDGNLYKMENGTGVGGIGGESNNQGDYPQPSDSSDLIAFKRAYERSPQSAAWWDENLNLDQYYSYRSIVEAVHHYDIAGGKNYFYFNNPDTGKWEVIPWDMDLTWADGMFGTGDEPFKSRVLAYSQYMREYRNRMREIRDLLYNPEQIGLIVDEIAAHVYTPGQPSIVDADRAMWDFNPILISGNVNVSKAGHGRYYAGKSGVPAQGDFAGMMQAVKNYAASRSAWIDANILTAGDEAVIPHKPVISYAGEAGYPVAGLAFATGAFSDPNGSAFAKMEWRLAEISNPTTPGFDANAPWKYEIDATWESGELSAYDSNVAIPAGVVVAGRTYRARVRMQDSTGRWSHWSDPLEFVPAADAQQQTLAITELHYHPANHPAIEDDEDLEFIEVTNVGDQAVDLAGVQITQFANTPYVFPAGLSLAPGERIVVARNPVAFQSVYGTGVNLAPTGYSDANLGNAGETIELVAADGTTVQSITWTDDPPWPTEPDGDGPSLEIIDPLGDSNDPANWRASRMLGGSPGWDGGPVTSGDYNRDGQVDGHDFLAWQRQLGTKTPAELAADGNGNMLVDAGDLGVWSDHYGTAPGSSSALAAAVLAEPAAALADTLLSDLPVPSSWRGGIGRGDAPGTRATDTEVTDALFAAGDFTSLFAPADANPLRPRGYRPPRRG